MPIKLIIIIGLPTRTKTERTTAGITIWLITPLSKANTIPKFKKNSIKKKSFSGLAREPICIFSGRFESASPAKNPPTSSDNPNGYATKVEKPRAQEILITNKSSGEFDATFSKI